MCDKIPYASSFEAQQIISQARHADGHKSYTTGRRFKHRHSYKPKRAYKCPECGMWHLTSQKKLKNKKVIGQNYRRINKLQNKAI